MNWVEIMALLKEAEYTQPQIAAHCRCAQSTISDIARGTNQHPRYEIGVCLQQLAARAKRKLAAKEKKAVAQYAQQPAARDAFLKPEDDTPIDNTSK